MPPYQYREQFLILDAGRKRLPSATERELLMGYPRGYAEPAVSQSSLKDEPKACDRIRAALLGNAFHVEVVAWLLSHLAVQRGYLTSVPDFNDLRADPAPRQGDFELDSRGFCLRQALVLHHLRGVCSKGSDVRMASGTLFNPSAFPRRAVDPLLWRWQTVVRYSWQETAHINELEMRAYLSAFKWRLRSGGNLDTKFLHLLDSQVSIGVLTKHRSGSVRLNRVARKVCALELASGSAGSFAFCRSSTNPADAPSRSVDAARPPSGR